MAKKRRRWPTSQQKEVTFIDELTPGVELQNMSSQLRLSEFDVRVAAGLLEGDKSDDFYQGMICGLTTVLGMLIANCARQNMFDNVKIIQCGAADILVRRGQ